MRPRAAEESRSPFLLLTVVSVTRPHWSETPMASSLPFGVLMWVVRMETQPVSLVAAFDADAAAAGSETSSAKRHAAFELCASAEPAPRVAAIAAAAKNELTNAFFILPPVNFFQEPIESLRRACKLFPSHLLREFAAETNDG